MERTLIRVLKSILIIGLFLGAVVLALGYKIFMLWLEMGETEQAAEGKSVVE